MDAKTWDEKNNLEMSLPVVPGGVTAELRKSNQTRIR